MLKGKHEIVIGILLGIAIFGFLASVLSYQASHCTHNEQHGTDRAPRNEILQAAPAPQNAGHAKVGEHHNRIDPICGLFGIAPSAIALMNDNEGFFVGLFTGLLFLATLLLWRSTNNLWVAGERQAANLLIRERCFIFPEQIEVQIGEDENQNRLFIFRMRWRNTGPTPASYGRKLVTA